MVVLGDSRTAWAGVKFGVPQGSVLGPILYLLYTADIPSLFTKHLTTGHLYADDVQTFVHGLPAELISLVGSIDSLSHDLYSWMSANRLNLNSSKTQLIWFGTKQQLLKLDLPLLTSLSPLLCLQL